MKYVGYMYGSSISDTSNTANSTIKGVIDTWYKNNMTSYTSKLEDIVFCNDRSYTITSTDSDGNSTYYFGAYTRLNENTQPILKCQNAKDKFTVNTSNGNGKLTYPVGLITADEMAYAGGRYAKWDSSGENSSFYLYNGMNNWTLSPGWTSDNDIAPAHSFITSAGEYGTFNVQNSAGVRPVISLKSGTILSSGSGTSSSPFVVE